MYFVVNHVVTITLKQNIIHLKENKLSPIDVNDRNLSDISIIHFKAS